MNRESCKEMFKIFKILPLPVSIYYHYHLLLYMWKCFKQVQKYRA